MIAVIPARGGSKRIPRKNIRSFAGRPIIAWSIAAARESGVFQRVLVSTDDVEIARIATDSGAEVLGLRPAELADDHTPVTAVISHLAPTIGAEADWICLIYATAPLLKAAILADAATRALTLPPQFDYLVSIARHASPIQRALHVVGDGRIEMISPEHALNRSQDLEPAYYDAAQFAFGRRAAWTEGRPLWGPWTCGHVVPRITAFDIDEPEDWDLVERLALATGSSPI